MKKSSRVSGTSSCASRCLGVQGCHHFWQQRLSACPPDLSRVDKFPCPCRPCHDLWQWMSALTCSETGSNKSLKLQAPGMQNATTAHFAEWLRRHSLFVISTKPCLVHPHPSQGPGMPNNGHRKHASPVLGCCAIPCTETSTFLKVWK